MTKQRRHGRRGIQRDLAAATHRGRTSRRRDVSSASPIPTIPDPAARVAAIRAKAACENRGTTRVTERISNMSDNITREELIRGLQELDDAERREVIAEASSREAGMQRAATALRNFNHPTRKD